ncbi:hypothetical protein FPV16_16315 [Methylobacterium sp. W2]|nr:hypothetical protein [Methylobacterium sp. W2]
MIRGATLSSLFESWPACSAERTVAGSCSAIGRLVDTDTPDACAHVSAAAGYEPDDTEKRSGLRHHDDILILAP